MNNGNRAVEAFTIVTANMSSSLHSIGTAPDTTPTKRFEAAHYEVRRIAANIAKLPELLGQKD
jgi:hypothetical protein